MPSDRLDAADRERFWEKVDRGADDECWEWQACTQGRGYGRFTLNGRTVLAHRVAAALVDTDVPIEPGRGRDPVVYHTCEMPSCVNPAHLSVRPPNAPPEEEVSSGD